jgi:hypothetical protein
MEAIYSYETLVDFQRTRERYKHRSENLKFYKF